MNKSTMFVELAKAGFSEKDRAINIPGWPWKIGDEICIPADLAAKWSLTQEQSEECSVITAFYSNSFKTMIFAEDGLDGDRFWEMHDVQWTPREALRKALAWIDQVPSGMAQCVTVSLDRDVMERLLVGEPCAMSYAAAISAALDWVDGLPVESMNFLPEFPRLQVEDGRDHPLARLLESEYACESHNDFEP